MDTNTAVKPATPREFRIWKTITLGTYKTPDEYRKALKSAGCRVNDWANDILGKTTCAQEETEIDLVVLSGGELGFEDEACYGDICAKGVEIGFELCPAEVGPALRLSYNDQPCREWLRIAIEAITADRYRVIFAVGHGFGELWLDGLSGRPEYFCHAVDRFVFLRPRKSAPTAAA